MGYRLTHFDFRHRLLTGQHSHLRRVIRVRNSLTQATFGCFDCASSQLSCPKNWNKQLGGRPNARANQTQRTTASVLDPIRTCSGFAHPTKGLLDVPEARLVINAARTFLHYLDATLTAVA